LAAMKVQAYETLWAGAQPL